MRRPARVFAPLCLIFAVLAASLALAGPKSFQEDFTTTLYMDGTYTTADWDTVAGSLHAPDFAPYVQATYPTTGTAGGICNDGQYAFVADGVGGLLVLRWSPTSPTLNLEGSCLTTNKADGVCVAGDYAYVAVGNGGLDVVDVSDMAAPSVVANYDTAGTVYDVKVAGNLAFLANYGSGLQILDISDPLNPSHVGMFAPGARALGLDLHGDLVLVAAEGYGIYIVDVSNPASPVQVGYYDTVGEAFDVAVSGNEAYVADGSAGLLVLDITDVTAPSSLAGYPTGDPAFGVDVAGPRVMVAAGNAGAVLFDMTDPANGTQIGTVASTGTAFDVVLAADLALVADDNDVHLVRLAQVADPTVVGQLSMADLIVDVAVSGRHAFVANQSQGLQIVSLADPLNPALAGSLPFPGTVRGVKVSGDYAYVAAAASGLLVVDVTDVTNPVLADSVGAPGDAEDVFVDGSLVFVADQTGGIWIYDAADPSNLSLLGSYAAAGSVQDIFVSGDRAYLGLNGPPMFEVVDVSDPTSPAYLGDLGGGLSCSGNSVVASRNTAYVADPCEYLNWVNVSNPANPTLGYQALDVPGPMELVLEGPYLHIGNGFPGYGLVTTTGSLMASPSGSVPGLHTVAPFGNYVVGGGSSDELVVLQVFQNEVDLSFNRNHKGQSLVLVDEGDEIIRLRFSTVESDAVEWFVNTGIYWFSFDPVTSWYELTGNQIGTQLRWQTRFAWATPGVTPSVSELTFEWLNHYPLIDAVEDVPNDQGRQVSLSWTRSGHDFAGDASQIVEYAVYRRIDPGLAKGALRPELSGLSEPARQHATAMATAGWHYLASVPVRLEDQYAVVVPSLVDSTTSEGMAYSTYRVSALTGTLGVFYDSPPDSGYSLDNLAPAPPQGLAFAGGTLSWNDPLDADFDYFTVYGSDIETWDETAVLIGATSGTSADVYGDPHPFYHVTATDFSGNEGQATSVPGQVTGTGGGSHQYLLRANAPNPFSSSTRIAYSLAEEAFTELSVYDLSGRLVRRLLAGTMPSGAHTASWDGRDERGRPVAVGVYLYRLRTPAFERTRRMILLR